LGFFSTTGADSTVTVTVGVATGASDLVVFRTISYYTLYSVSFLSSFTHLYLYSHFKAQNGLGPKFFLN